MSAQRLGAKLTRRIARETGQQIVRAWGHGGYVMEFVADGHRHGWWSGRDGTWGWDEPADVVHYTSCDEMFPEEATTA